MGGWRFISEVPTERKAVMLAAPHTSNLDGMLLVMLAQSVQMEIAWMVKDVWGKPPHGYLVKGVGGVPVDRSRANGMVGHMVEEFARRDHFHLVIPPEGTRSLTTHWKSGFYRIAVGADVPVIPGFLDYANKTGGFGPPIRMTGDPKADMDEIREFYGDATSMAKFPEKFGPIRLRSEEES